MPETGPGAGTAKEAAWRDSLGSRSERAWQDAQSAWARAQAIQARQEDAARASAREPRTSSLSGRLEARLTSMAVIEQAKGVLMASQGCDADKAFDLLCEAAERSNLPVHELAEQILKKAQQGEASA